MENIRIAHIIPSLAKGGAERLALDICNALNKQPGLEVKLVVFSDVNTYPQLSSTVDVEIIPSNYTPSLTGKSVNNTTALRSFFDRFKPHVIHLHLFEAEIAARATEYYNAVYITHCHYNTVEYKKFSFASLLNKTLFTRLFERAFVLKHTKLAKANSYIAISKDTQLFFKENLPSPLKENIILQLNAINYNSFAKAPLPTAPTTELRLINTGSFITRKNQQYLVQVLHALIQKGINAKLHLLGNGVERNNIENLVASLNLKDHVIAPGLVENVEDYLAASHLYLHAATFEPFGLVLVEAMAAGLPVIALDGHGNRDVNVEGKTGYLMPANTTPEDFADKIIAITSNPQQYKEMSTYARNFAKGFDIDEYTQKLLAEYKKLL
ncbi:MAG: glycosyltransferase [Sphingobacteriales bacterium JAD_PAG50586_3]|nr:MAG: glycosyltransferase [Sphingobacteriales bacterium JAD_PAG50586_3]